MSSVVDREKEFHDSRFGSNTEPRSAASKYYTVAKNANNYINNLVAKYAKPENRLLEYGCGTGGDINFFHSYGYRIIGIDISEEGIKKAKNKAAGKSIAADYYVVNAENTDFDDSSFDLVLGSGILHHLDVKKSLRELSRIMKQDGHALFFEPMGHNLLINTYRSLTSSMRSNDEHPLKFDDIEIMSNFFEKINVRYFCIFSLMSVPLRNTVFFNTVYRALEKFDSVLMSAIPILKKYAWIVVIDLSIPKRNGEPNL